LIAISLFILSARALGTGGGRISISCTWGINRDGRK
jgi:hypothetical protein